MRILVVDDESDFVQLVKEILEKENFVVSSAKDGREALERAQTTRPDLILLDWVLPTQSGLEVCKALKADPMTKNIPVIMLTSRSRESDIVLGLEGGADDYMIKRGLRARELTARIRANLRKGSGGEADASEILTSGNLSLDRGCRTVKVSGKTVDLRPKEFALLQLFLHKKGRVLTRSYLSEVVWGTEFLHTSRTIDTTIAQLRSLIGKEGEKIRAVSGVGYKFNESEET